FAYTTLFRSGRCGCRGHGCRHGTGRSAVPSRRRGTRARGAPRSPRPGCERLRGHGNWKCPRSGAAPDSSATALSPRRASRLLLSLDPTAFTLPALERGRLVTVVEGQVMSAE